MQFLGAAPHLLYQATHEWRVLLLGRCPPSPSWWRPPPSCWKCSLLALLGQRPPFHLLLSALQGGPTLPCLIPPPPPVPRYAPWARTSGRGFPSLLSPPWWPHVLSVRGRLGDPLLYRVLGARTAGFFPFLCLPTILSLLLHCGLMPVCAPWVPHVVKID